MSIVIKIIYMAIIIEKLNYAKFGPLLTKSSSILDFDIV